LNGLGRKKEQNQTKKSVIFTKEMLGVVLVLFATLSLICLITGDALFSTPGKAVSSFFFGCFGFFAYAVVIGIIALGVVLITGKKLKISLKRKILITLCFAIIAMIAHVATLNEGLSFGGYIKESYAMGANGLKGVSGGGACTAILVFGLVRLLTNVGCYVVLSVAFAGVTYAFVYDLVRKPKAKVKKQKGGLKFRTSYVKEQKTDKVIDNVKIEGEMEYPVAQAVEQKEQTKQKLFVNSPEDFQMKTKRELHREQTNPTALKITFSEGGLGIVTGAGQERTEKPVPQTEDYKQKLEYIKSPAAFNIDEFLQNDKKESEARIAQNDTYVSEYITPKEQTVEEPVIEEIPFIEHGEKNNAEIVTPTETDSAQARARIFGSRYLGLGAEEEQTTSPIEQPKADNEEIFRPFEETVVDEPVEEQPTVEEIPFIDQTEETVVPEPVVEEKQVEIEPEVSPSRRIRNIFLGEEKKEEKQEENPPVVKERSSGLGSSRRSSLFAEPVKEEKEQVKEEKPQKVAPPINRLYHRPPFDLLKVHLPPVNAGQENHEERMEIIKRTLEEFHINVVPQTYVQGPSITRYEITMPAGISVKNILKYDDDLKMRLAVKDGVRIQAPIPGKNLVGIEVANTVKTTVGFREVMEGLSQNPKKGSLVFAIGKDIVGNCISYDLAKGPHYLIAGATGSGKSVCLHVMLASLLMRYSPEELKLVLVDPKSVEFRKYEHIPHLLVDEIITEHKRALALLQWAYDETNRRNEMFTECGGAVSNIDDYNSLIASDTVAKLPRIVFVIDELADLMESCKKDLEEKIRKIAAKSRSAGIHLVLATQRPSVDVITGTIKANLPSRIALKVMNFADSQTILGGAGAEKLLGYGDMLYKDSSMGDYERYQGAYVSGAEITNLVNYIKEKNKAYFDEDVKEFLDKETRPQPEESAPIGDDEGGGDDENSLLFLKALWLGVNTGQMSISLLQRRFRVGYGRAGSIVDKMERQGYVSGNEGSKARRVLLTKEEFIDKFGPMDEDDMY